MEKLPPACIKPGDAHWLWGLTYQSILLKNPLFVEIRDEEND